MYLVTRHDVTFARKHPVITPKRTHLHDCHTRRTHGDDIHQPCSKLTPPRQACQHRSAAQATTSILSSHTSPDRRVRTMVPNGVRARVRDRRDMCFWFNNDNTMCTRARLACVAVCVSNNATSSSLATPPV